MRLRDVVDVDEVVVVARGETLLVEETLGGDAVGASEVGPGAEGGL